MRTTALFLALSLAACGVEAPAEGTDEHGATNADVVPPDAVSTSQELSGCFSCAARFWSTTTRFTYLRIGPGDGYAIRAGVGAGQLLDLGNYSNNRVCPSNGYYYVVRWSGLSGWVNGAALGAYSCG